MPDELLDTLCGPAGPEPGALEGVRARLARVFPARVAPTLGVKAAQRCFHASKTALCGCCLWCFIALPALSCLLITSGAVKLRPRAHFCLCLMKYILAETVSLRAPQELQHDDA